MQFSFYTLLYPFPRKTVPMPLLILNIAFVARNVDFGDILTPDVKKRHKNTIYDLVANIVHDGEPGKGTYRVHVLHKVGLTHVYFIYCRNGCNIK
jgi:hypothetical protein